MLAHTLTPNVVGVEPTLLRGGPPMNTEAVAMRGERAESRPLTPVPPRLVSSLPAWGQGARRTFAQQ